MMDRPMPASPQNSSSISRTMLSPVGSLPVSAMISHAVEADLGRLFDDGPRVFLFLVPFLARRSDDALGEVVHPLLELELVLVECE